MEERRVPEEKPDGDSIELKFNSPFMRWLDNFWYHYKWHTIVVGFLLIVILFCIFQQVGEPKQDILITYSGSYLFSTSEVEKMQKALSDEMPKDFDGDGTKYAGLVHYEIYSAEEIEALRAENDGDNVVNLPYNTTQFSNFNQFVTTGESSIFFCSPYIYGVLSERGCLAKLKDVLGHEVDSSADGYGVALKDTALYLDEPVLAFLPEDTVVCMMVPFAWGSSAKEEYYANAKEMFRTIVEGTK